MVTNRKQRSSSAATTEDKPKRRRVKVKAGQLVAIPLLDGTFALGHVAHYYYLQVTLAHFSHRASTPEGLLVGLDEAFNSKLIAMLAVTHVDIYDGNWPVIGYQEPDYPAALLDMKGHSATSTMSTWLLEAYYGLRPWDGLHSPKAYEKELLPGVPIPATVRYKRDFQRDSTEKATNKDEAL